MKVKDQSITDRYSIYNGDSCEVLQGIPDNSIGFEIYSPPFMSLYTYSNSERDLGNTKNDDEFYEQFKFIAKELYRVLAAGRLMSVHCMDVPAMKEKDGYIGLKDFSGELIKMFTDIGFIYHSRVTIWKDPLIEATRTKALGLLHKQIEKDSTMSRNGLPDYLITFRKQGINEVPIAHPEGFVRYFGDEEPDKRGGVYSHQVWRKYASPVWMDINQSNTLNKTSAREDADEKHICPLQLDVISRAIELWSNPDDIVLTPFGGIGSEAYKAIEMGRRAVAIELKESYYRQMQLNLEAISRDMQKEQMTLF